MPLKGLVIVLLFFSAPCFAAGNTDIHYSLTWGIPFLGILLSIALGPTLIPKIWHRYFGTITVGWILLFLIPFVINFKFAALGPLLTHAVIEEYIPFIILLLSLFTVSGGILIQGNLHGSPKLNVILLTLGTLLSSLMGTTGAAMLLIRPLIRANDNRKHNMHVIIFFIFLVANIGGGLTPLGDPPLFLGFLKGVSFLWTVNHLFVPVMFCSIILLLLFYLIDTYYYRKEDEVLKHDPTPDRSIVIKGTFNFVLLIAIVGCVLLSGIWQPNITLDIFNTDIKLQNIIRDFLLILITFISWLFTSPVIREKNDFSWEPILEVAKLFIGIFITIVPVIAILRMGNQGDLAWLVAKVTDQSGQPIDNIYFWMTGLLSGFLDNAPTYLVFFNLASGDATLLMQTLPSTLMAISAGAVFMGALTYIGNAPNFMVKSIAVNQNINMPSFFGYMKWSVTILLPLFILLSIIFF